MATKFKKNDQVIVIAGSNKGKIGSILSIRNNRVLVDGINLATVHKKPTSNQAGEIIKIAKPIHISNISHIEDGKSVKIGFKIDPKVSENAGKNFAEKTRISKKTGKKID